MPKEYDVLLKEDMEHRDKLKREQKERGARMAELNKFKQELEECDRRKSEIIKRRSTLVREMEKVTRFCSSCSTSEWKPVGQDRSNCASCIDEMRG